MIPRPPHKIELVVVGLSPKEDPITRFLNPPREIPVCITAANTDSFPVKLDCSPPKQQTPFYRKFQKRRRNR